MFNKNKHVTLKEKNGVNLDYAKKSISRLTFLSVVLTITD